VYGSDLATLRCLAEARHLTLEAESAGTPLGYELWEDRRAALRRFVQHERRELKVRVARRPLGARAPGPGMQALRPLLAASPPRRVTA
jgi:hypothetical protein